ncbi:hypothetical protein G7046_g2943 [Stylonectria norvegica]|nr:hypothetical protein G7046_g2943 [Stylonectria norvegica]
MALKPGDAIHPDELAQWTKFMDSQTDTQFVHMHLHDGMVKVDVYEDPSNDLAHSKSFTPSPKADEFFEQQLQYAKDLGLLDDSEAERRSLQCVVKEHVDEHVGRFVETLDTVVETEGGVVIAIP